jgi:hypothetical protein
MRRSVSVALTGLTMAVVLPLGAAAGQDNHVLGYSVSSSSREAAVGLQLAGGGALKIALKGGEVLIDGATVGQYREGGPLETEWRALLTRAGGLTADEAVGLLQQWKPSGLTGTDAASLKVIRAKLGGIAAMEAVPVPPAPPPQPEIAEAVSAARDAAAASRDQVRALRDEIRASVKQDIRQSIRESVRPSPSVSLTSPVQGIFSGLLGLFGAFVALSAIGFGASFFAGRQLDVIADTVSTSFARSFFVGLFAQPLLIPAFGAMIVGLTLTVIGILVIPVAILAFLATLVAAVIGGYLAIARVAGSVWMKRRKGDHGTEGFGILRSVAYGLAILLAVWVPAVVLGGTPVAGSILTWTAALATWALVTTGFGAAILTRGGVRTTFGRRFTPRELPPASLFERPGPEISTAEWMAQEDR